MKITKQQIISLPKSELHCHLDGSIRFDTVIDLASEYKISLPTTDEEKLGEYLICGRVVDSLVSYLDAFRITLSVLQDKDALKRAAFELVEDAALENVLYLEVRFSPVLHQQKGLELSEVVDAVLEGLREGEKKYDIQTNLILCAMRERSVNESVAIANLCCEYSEKGIAVIFDLAGAEIGNPPKKHKKSLQIVAKNFLNCTIHAGEVFGPRSIAQALLYRAHRIGHGTSLIKDTKLLEYIADHQIPLEVCLTSNLQTSSVSSVKDHPFPLFLNKGVKVTINTDNRLMSATDLSSEYCLAVNEYDLSWDSLRCIVLSGFESAFLPLNKKNDLLQKVHNKLEEFENEHGLGN